jgi:hypothetical protein
MVRRASDPKRTLQDVPLTVLVDRIVRRIALESGDDPLLCGRDLRAAIDDWQESRIMLEVVVRTSWKEIGDRLGVSAQAAHRKYGPSFPAGSDPRPTG